jgi:hypothetical protein
LFTLISEFYDLGVDAVETTCFQYQNYMGQQINWIRLLENESLENKMITKQERIQGQLIIEDILMSCLLKPSNIFETQR